jgi:hypothetical protein
MPPDDFVGRGRPAQIGEQVSRRPYGRGQTGRRRTADPPDKLRRCRRHRAAASALELQQATLQRTDRIVRNPRGCDTAGHIGFERGKIADGEMRKGCGVSPLRYQVGPARPLGSVESPYRLRNRRAEVAASDGNSSAKARDAHRGGRAVRLLLGRADRSQKVVRFVVAAAPEEASAESQTAGQDEAGIATGICERHRTPQDGLGIVQSHPLERGNPRPRSDLNEKRSSGTASRRMFSGACQHAFCVADSPARDEHGRKRQLAATRFPPCFPPNERAHSLAQDPRGWRVAPVADQLDARVEPALQVRQVLRHRPAGRDKAGRMNSALPLDLIRRR